MSIFLLRHGETDYNLERRMQGQSQTSLNKTGLQQALDVVSEVTKLGISLVYCSKIKRAIQTASIVGEKLPIVYDGRLNERSYGVWENLLWDDVQTMNPELKTLMTDVDFKPVDGESIRDVIKRTLEALSEIYAREAKGETILVVGHGGPFKIITGYIAGIAPEDYYKQKVFKNCQLSKIK